MIKSKKQSLIVIGVFTLVLMLGTVTYAFFNYTRTGTANVIKTGRISFSTNQTDTINLTNVFPIDKTTIGTDTTNTDEVVISITGDTTYSEGIEYLVTATDVNNTIGSGNNQKTVPISISVTASNLGTEDEEYFDNRENANSHLYRILSNNVVEENGRIAVGYIKSGATGINGSLTIKSYLDKDKIGISDTYDGTESNSMGTTNEWAVGRTILTTNEWNTLQTNGVSFKIKVEANEGVWVEEIRSVNAMSTLPVPITNEKTNISEVHFTKMGTTRMQNEYDDATIKADLTSNDIGKVLTWLENDPNDNTKYIMIIASDGDTYLPESISYFFVGFTNVKTIDFSNVNTSRVTNMSNMFAGCSKLTELDLSSFDTSSVEYMSYMFAGCNNLTEVNLGGLGGNNLSSISYMFAGCNSLSTIDMSDFNFNNASMYMLFQNLTSLENVDLTGANTINVDDMSNLFYGCSSLKSIDLSGLGGNRLTSLYNAFYNCDNLEEINLSNFNFGNTSLHSLLTNHTKLETVYLTKANFSQVSSMEDMFKGCTNLSSVDMSGVNTAGVQVMGGMFEECTSITTIDLSDIDFTGNISMYRMFKNASNLETIYVSNNWNYNYIQYDSDMFEGCTSLVGTSPNGTTYAFDSNDAIDKTYAKIATDNEKGYLTDISLKPTN